ncbi:MAG: hypothetical protein ISS69_18590 [Phycisphaerae bacterium]|nr:hypothetical protein [Phycisphaerae bacterium]
MTTSIQDIPVAQWIERLASETGLFRVVQTGRFHGQYDLRVVLQSDADHQVTLYVETKSRVTPKLALGMLDGLSKVPADGHAMLCTYSVSPRVAEICRQNSVAYLDEAGNCWIRTPGLYVHVTGHPSTRPDTRPAVDPFAQRSSRITRVLLGSPSEAWTLSDLAKKAKVSLGLVWKVKKTLMEDGFIQTSDKRIVLSDAAGLLDAWKKRYRIPAEKVSLYAIGKTDQLESRLCECCKSIPLRCALTGLSGAWRVAPMVRYTTASAYVETGSDSSVMADLIQRMEAKPVDTGANLVLYPTRDESVFYGMRPMSGHNVVSPIQLYLDLLKVPGRGEDAANEIMAKGITPLFKRSKPD